MTTRADLVAAIAVERGAVRMARAHGQTGQTEQDRVDDLVARLVDLDRAAAR